MPATNVLIVAVDGLRASSLGAYGNTTFPTPALDQFAAASALCDACYATSASLPEIYRACWHSHHPLRPAAADEPEQSLPHLFSRCGYATTLITDDPEVAALPAAAGFDDRIQVAATTQRRDLPADEPGQTALGRLFAAVCDAIATDNDAGTGGSGRDDRRPPRLVWVHSRGMYGPWDAPLELQQMLLDEGDPPPRQDVASPDFMLSEVDDPDTPFQVACAYAAQTMVLDACWSALMEALAAHTSGPQWLTMLIGVRGFPLGEHRRIGGIDGRLFADQLHVPWLTRFPAARHALVRTPALTSHLDLLPTLFDAMGRAEDGHLHCDGVSILSVLAMSRTPWRDALLSSSAQGARAIRTLTWTLRQDAVVQNAHETLLEADPLCRAELYVRPDDRWEANDIAKLCPDVVEQLARVSDDIAEQLAAGGPLRLQPAPAADTAGTQVVPMINAAANDC